MKRVCAVCGKEIPEELTFNSPKIKEGELVKLGYCLEHEEEAHQLLTRMFEETRHEVHSAKRVLDTVQDG